MPNDAQNSLAALLAKGSPSFRRANAHLLSLPTDHPRPAAQLERRKPATLPKADKAKGGHPNRYLARVTSVRNRLLDEDNLCEKYHVDALRYAGALPSDAPGTCRIITTQRETLPGEAEHVVIEIDKVA